MYPKYTAKKPKKILKPVYSKTEANCPFCINVKFSSVNDENVVNPPQIPTIKNKRKLGVIISLLAEMPTIKPMIKLPKTLTVNVPNGIENIFQYKFSFDTKNLATLPINPPKPTNKICFIY